MKYYLMRNIGGLLQFSDVAYTSYKQAERMRNKQVNPSHWYIVVNPILSRTSCRIDINKVAIKQAEKLRAAFEILRELNL